MTVLAALDTLLYRYSGQENMPDRKHHLRAQSSWGGKMLGFFLNTVVLRSDLTGDPTFLELLDRVRRTTIEALVVTTMYL